MLQAIEKKLIKWDCLPDLALSLHRNHKKIVSSNGCFDILHWGHIRYLFEAKDLGDILIVGINSDSSVKKLKGPNRPLLSESFRLRQLAALSAVDYTFTFEQETPVEFLKILKPQIHVKGADYRGKKIPESEVLKEWSGQLVFLEIEKGFSTSQFIERIKEIPT